MADIAQIYTTAVYNNLRPLYANWDPDRPVELGVYGVLRGRMFVPLGTFDDRSLLTEVVNPHPRQKSFTTKGGTQVTFHAGGAAPAGGAADVRASLEIGFTSEDAVFFNAAGCTFHSVADKVALGKEVAKRYNAGSAGTTMIDTHVPGRGGRGVRNPLDTGVGATPRALREATRPSARQSSPAGELCRPKQTITEHGTDSRLSNAPDRLFCW